MRGLPVRVVGVDVKEQSPPRQRGGGRATLGLADAATFVQADIGSVELPGPAPDVVLALHACDTATDDALARAVRWEAPLVLAAPCCHHDVAAQLKEQPASAPAPYSVLVRDGILRERFADTLTDALRAAILRHARLPRRRRGVRREQAHAAQHAAARGAHRRRPASRRTRSTSSPRPGTSGPRLAELLA